MLEKQAELWAKVTYDTFKLVCGWDAWTCQEVGKLVDAVRLRAMKTHDADIAESLESLAVALQEELARHL